MEPEELIWRKFFINMGIKPDDEGDFQPSETTAMIAAGFAMLAETIDSRLPGNWHDFAREFARE